MAETINGLYKAEVIHRRGPWRSFEAVEYATLEWVGWFNHRRLLEAIGNIPPAEAEAQYHAVARTTSISQRDSHPTASGKPGAVQRWMSICRKPYPSDVSDEEWSLVATYLLLQRAGAGQREHDLREVFNGLATS